MSEQDRPEEAPIEGLETAPTSAAVQAAGDAPSASEPSDTEAAEKPGADAEPHPSTEPGASPEPPVPSEPLDEKAQRRAEIESFLGPTVKTPVGIPDGYIPNDRSIHRIFHVELTALDFAGPLDLLLYLVRKHEMEILDINISLLTDRYLEMLRTLEALEIDIAAEFLVLAAELTHIKSKMLLPAEEGVAVEDPPDEAEQGDPRQELIRRLLEYQKYRDAAMQLADRDQLGRDVFPRVPPEMDKVEDLDPGLKQVSVFRLVELMAKLLREVPIHHEISYESFSIGERIQYVSAFGEAHEGRFTVMALMSRIQTRNELVVTFIALLEMAKMGLVRIRSEVFHAAGDEEAAPPTATPEASVAGEGSERTDDTGEASTDTAAEGAAETGGLGPEAVESASPGEPGSDEAAAARAEAEALEALAEEAAAEEALGLDAVDLPEAPVEPSIEPLEPLPEIWVELTEKRFQGDLVDDYK